MRKIYPAVIGSSHKIYDMLPYLSPSILYHHILPLSILQKKSEIALRTLLHSGNGGIFPFLFPFKPGLLKCLIYVVLEGGGKSTKNGLAMGVTIGDDAAKIGKSTHLLVIICVR